MPAPVSVIVPTLNVARSIGPCLGAIAQGLDYGVIAEVILTDGGSSDDISEIADTIGAAFITGPKGRGAQLSAGAKQAKADWFLFIHADTVLAENWPQVALSHIAQNPDKAGYFILKFDQSGLAAKTVARWANFRSQVFDLPYGDQGLLISRTLYDQIGGYANIPLMEDVAMAKTLNGTLIALDATATTSAARYQKYGWFRQSLRNFSLLMRYKRGVDPEKLAAQYRR
ncbi:MAG: TIGR04283 family arsenosugar biosynthesis glycosyltransferase [Rhodobacteraceae bacterium]|nr:TIGR04283 family arsenosugar biosynthesis glycosyltransferase [Paracoccaceae bacterium]